ncbi:hypothetical protein OAP74_01515 [bacterium]|nr:hypothetical protein [bacterium]
MTNRLTEQQLQEELLDEIGDFTKAITRKIGQGVGGFKGAGQKVKGAVSRAGQGLKQAYTQGRDSAQKTVAGQDYKAPQPKAQAQPQAQAQGQTKTKPTGVMKNLAKNLGNVALDTAAGDGYDYRKGVNPNPTKQVPVGKQDTQAQTQTQTQAQATKRTKTGGKVAGQVSNTASAQSQRDRRAAKKNAVSTGISQAQKNAANQGVANMQKQAGQTATKVPGQKKPTSTAQNVGKNAGVNTAKIGGQKVDLNDPKMKGLRAAIEKASPGSISAIDKMQPADKAKLKKAIA